MASVTGITWFVVVWLDAKKMAIIKRKKERNNISYNAMATTVV